jgi:hypothetical protein
LSHFVIKRTQTYRLLIFIVGRIYDMSIPQCIICQNPTSFTHQWQHQVQIIAIFLFICVDKYKIKLSVDIKDGKTIATYKGTITDKETGETTPYEEQLVFDYIFTRTVMN